MSDQPKTRLMHTPEPIAGDLQHAIHGLHGIFEVLDWIESVEIGVNDDRLRDARAELLIAGQLIIEDFRRRF